MGSFNVACTVSNLSINCYDEIIYIPLQSNNHYKIGDGNNMLIYENCFYDPVTLPIYGLYDDYGCIGEIVRDHNVFTIENYFKKSIEQICDPIEYRTDPINSGMFVLKSIYDILVQNMVDDFNKPIKLNSIKKNYKKFKKDLNHNAKLFYSYPNTPAFSEIINTFTDYHVQFFPFRDYKTFMKVYWQQIYFGNLKKEMIKFRNFCMGLHATNNFFFPAMNGYQFGNKYMSHILARKIHSITLGK
jgi:hypothetical protein